MDKEARLGSRLTTETFPMPLRRWFFPRYFVFRDEPGPVPRLTGAETRSMRAPVYSELDINGHVNNARYADWLCDALGLETMRAYRVRTMRLSYAAEIRPGQEMELHLTRDGLAYHLTGTHEGKTHFEIGGDLARRT